MGRAPIIQIFGIQLFGYFVYLDIQFPGFFKARRVGLGLRWLRLRRDPNFYSFGFGPFTLMLGWPYFYGTVIRDYGLRYTAAGLFCASAVSVVVYALLYFGGAPSVLAHTVALLAGVFAFDLLINWGRMGEGRF